jgi:hypothetical protein
MSEPYFRDTANVRQGEIATTLPAPTSIGVM